MSKRTIAALVALAVLVVLAVLAALAGCPGTQHPTSLDSDAGPAPADAGSQEASAEAAVALVVPQDVPPVDASAKEVVPAAPYAPTVEEKQAICLGALYALTPDWHLDACEVMQTDEENGDQRQARCRAQRAPLMKFATDICKTVVTETDRLGLDLLLPIAVMERESSIGRVRFDRDARVFRVETDICKLYLSTSRIVAREPGRRPGTEKLTWTYSDGENRQHQNTQMIIVESEDAGGLHVNTCVAGETGLFQLLPQNYGNGKCIGLRTPGGRCDGQVLRGTREERREEVLDDPILQVKLGLQELVRHRGVCPEERRQFWPDWISVYNLGVCDPSREKWAEYACKVLGHYLTACRLGYVVSAGSAVPEMLENVWPECRRVAEREEAFCRDR